VTLQPEKNAGNRKLKQDSLMVLKPLKCWEKEKLLRIP